MNIKGNISDSLKYPIKNWIKIIILGIILIIPIVNLIGLGYYLRILKSTIMGLDELPDFKSVGELFIDGIKLLIVGIIYTIVPSNLLCTFICLSRPGISHNILYFCHNNQHICLYWYG